MSGTVGEFDHNWRVVTMYDSPLYWLTEGE